jgi:hypothetical protein
METPDQSAPEGKIPVVYTKEHLEREAAKKRRTEEQKHGEKAAIDSLCSEHLAYRPSIGKTGAVYVVRPVVR